MLDALALKLFIFANFAVWAVQVETAPLIESIPYLPEVGGLTVVMTAAVFAYRTVSKAQSESYQLKSNIHNEINKSLRDENARLRADIVLLVEENTTIRTSNTSLVEENIELREYIKSFLNHNEDTDT